MNVQFKQWNCEAIFDKYADGSMAISLIDTQTKQPIAKATVRLPNLLIKLADDEVIIKDYSENEGMLEALIAAGTIAAPHAYAHTRFQNLPVCRVIKVT